MHEKLSGLVAYTSVDEWTVQELVATIGSVERPAVVKSLATWVEHGVLKEDSPSIFQLLNVAETDMSSRTAQKQPGTLDVVSSGCGNSS